MKLNTLGAVVAITSAAGIAPATPLSSGADTNKTCESQTEYTNIINETQELLGSIGVYLDPSRTPTEKAFSVEELASKGLKNIKPSYTVLDFLALNIDSISLENFSQLSFEEQENTAKAWQQKSERTNITNTEIEKLVGMGLKPSWEWIMAKNQEYTRLYNEYISGLFVKMAKKRKDASKAETRISDYESKECNNKILVRLGRFRNRIKGILREIDYLNNTPNILAGLPFKYQVDAMTLFSIIGTGEYSVGHKQRVIRYLEISAQNGGSDEDANEVQRLGESLEAISPEMKVAMNLIIDRESKESTARLEFAKALEAGLKPK